MTWNYFTSPRRIPRLLALLAFISVACWLVLGLSSAGAATGATRQHEGRGTLVSATPLRSWSAAQTARALRRTDFTAAHVRFGVDAYRLVYRTLDPAGGQTTASGLLVLPRRSRAGLESVLFDHGTEVFRGDAPSIITPGGFADPPAIAYAAAGFAGIAPDYLGLGTGSGAPPYLDVGSEVDSTLDMLRASRSFVQAHGGSLRRSVIATGFSQGAVAALAVARAVQGGAAPSFRVAAVEAISGPFDIQHAEIPALLHGALNAKIGVLYISYFLVAWNRLYHLYASPAAVFRAPYDHTVPHLFDGRHTDAQVIAATPGSVKALLTPAGLRMLRAPTGRLKQALRVSDSVCSDWSPSVPVHLYSVAGDEQVATRDTDDCRRALAARDVHATLDRLRPSPYQGSRHLGSAVAGIAAILDRIAR